MEETETKLSITKLPGRSILIIKQIGKPKFFVSSHNAIVIEIPVLTSLIKQLIVSGFLSKKVLEGILSELEE